MSSEPLRVPYAGLRYAFDTDARPGVPVAHTCRESEDPRRKGQCACGKPVPVSDTTLVRDPVLEEQIVRQAAQGVCDPSALIEHAQTRARVLSGEYVQNPMHIRQGRDRQRDMREELADCVNHGTFWVQEHREEMGSERMQDVLIALRFVALAYDRLREK